jgi:hypothetical protein
MKKVILVVFLALGLSQVSNAQINFGIKGGINYNNNGDATLSSTGNDIINGAESKSGFHAGVWFRGKLPILGLYLRPELVYTQVKSEYTYKSAATDYDFKKLDVPVLLGKKVLGFGNVFIGPSFQYIIEDDFSFSDLSSDDFDKFSVGMQMGFGVEFGNVGLDVRWERGLSDSEARFTDNNTNITVDNRTNQIIFGLSLQL